MQHKISFRQRLAIIIIAAVDVLMLIVAAILDSLRESLPTEYVLNDDGKMITSHPLDSFGIVVAVALAIVSAMFAFAIINIINSDDKKQRGRIAGFVVLFVVSLAVVMFSFFWVQGSKAESTATYDYTDSEMSLLLFEERYPDEFGTLTVFVSDYEHNEVVLLATTDIHRHSASADDYYIDWIMENMLRITFLDGDSYRSIQIDLAQVLGEEHQHLLQGGESTAHDHVHA